MKKFIFSLFVWSMVFSFALVGLVSADSTIGANMSTTGTLTVNNNSGTAVRFQRSGTNIFVFNTTAGRLGIDSGGNLDTKFEVGGTASAENLLINGAVQFAGNSASVAYSRFGTTTTNHNNYISASNDLLVSGDAELRGSVSFGGVASISGIVYMNDGRFKANANSTTAFRFQNAAGTVTVLTVDTTNNRINVNAASASANLVVNAGAALDTTFEVGGTASISGIITLAGSGSTGGQIRPAVNATTAFRFQNAAGTTNVLVIDTTNTRVGVNAGGDVDTTFEAGGLASISNASISDRFELTSSTARFGINAGGFTDTAFEVGAVASVGTNLNVGEVATATVSITFETRSTTQGACFTILGNNGTTYYARIVASGDDADGDWWVSTKNCN